MSSMCSHAHLFHTFLLPEDLEACQQSDRTPRCSSVVGRQGYLDHIYTPVITLSSRAEISLGVLCLHLLTLTSPASCQIKFPALEVARFCFMDNSGTFSLRKLQS